MWLRGVAGPRLPGEPRSRLSAVRGELEGPLGGKIYGSWVLLINAA